MFKQQGSNFKKLIFFLTNNNNLKLIINLNVRSKIIQLPGEKSIFVITLCKDFLERTKNIKQEYQLINIRLHENKKY